MAPWLQRQLFVAVVLLLVASCSGGGCSSGCSSCGMTPLPNGFPKPETIPNAGTVRITRPGLNFVQDNLATMAEKALGTNAKAGVAAFTIPPSTNSGATVCSTSGPPVPPQCQAEIDLASAKLRVNAITPNRVKLDGVLPVRIRDLPVKFSFFNTYVVAGDRTKAPGQDLCADSLKGSPTFPFKEFPLNVELPLVTETRPPRIGYTKVDVEKAIIDIGITKNDVEICDDTCGGACQFLTDWIKDFAFNSLIGGVKNQIKDALGSAFCTAPSTATPSCPFGSTPDDPDPTKAKKCMITGSNPPECVPSLLGFDGHMDLSRALAAFSPGTQGGLDFVLASAGDMDPAPATPGLPAWTPRKPPVPAQDNNANGVSLTMLGGALAQPNTNCVDIVRRSPPQDIPFPAELKQDVITPWPQGMAGPHLGFALAGRYLDHAFLGAYNAGLLCLGISTETADQLNSGVLSLLAPSIKTLTFEQATAAAAIATRPGVPPKVKIGNGTDVNTDPLLKITLEKLAIDFYIFSFDRFVRIFTYTADVSVPVNIQTGKDATNPKGGLLPVLGKLSVTNASLANGDKLLFEESAPIVDGVTGLLGGIVGQFLGGGFSPIDLQGALQSFGLGIDIPAGGLRKITSGTDDFLAVFANLTPAASAAREEADTRAVLVAKIVDPQRMGLATAERAHFPKLHVHVEGIASRPTEHTWWIDRALHTPWTTASDIVVDQDSMLMQGKHVLHVSSRVVGEMTSEDGTPVEIPFTIDTLPPIIDVKHEGDRVVVRAADFVSASTELVARRRFDDGAWTDWLPLAQMSSFTPEAKGANVDVEVKDEEGNIGQVRQSLIRGNGDPTLVAAGSGCGCRATGASSNNRDLRVVGVFGAAFAFGLALRRRAIRTRSHVRDPSKLS